MKHNIMKIIYGSVVATSALISGFIMTTPENSSRIHSGNVPHIMHIEKSLSCINEAKQDIAPNATLWTFVVKNKENVENTLNNHDQEAVPKIKNLAKQLYANDTVYNKDIATYMGNITEQHSYFRIEFLVGKIVKNNKLIGYGVGTQLNDPQNHWIGSSENLVIDKTYDLGLMLAQIYFQELKNKELYEKLEAKEKELTAELEALKKQ